jgi:flavin reductase (DIM6/NTAB) family NADH-FMN oxidoreductase RutF
LCFTSVGHKDTLANVRATGEFVLNIGTAAQLALMNDSATDLPAHVSEFDAAGIAREPSLAVRPPRVAGAPIAFECRVSGEHAIGSCVMVFGEVLVIAADPGVLAPDGLPDATRLAPLARLGRSEWTTLGPVVSLRRLNYEQFDGGRRSAGGLSAPDPAR